MQPQTDSLTLAQVAELVGGTLEGDPQAEIVGVESLSRARKKHLSFFNRKHTNKTHIEKCKAGVLLVEPGTEKPEKVGALIFVSSPTDAVTRVYEQFLPKPTRPPVGVHPTAVIAESAEVGEGASIGPYCVIGEGVTIGPNALLHPHVVIMEGTQIGANFTAYPHTVIREFCELGDDVLLQAGAVIGTDGFGYILREGELRLVPQLGNVKLESDVHIGANTAIDRARFGATRIGKGTKIDNLCQIGHNVSIGVACGIAAQTGIAGSCEIGDFCDFGGQTGIAHSIKIGAGARLLARCGVIKDVPAGVERYDFPAMTAREMSEREVYLRKLGSVIRQVRDLTKRVSKLDGDD